MIFLINASNLKIGGGLQVADSFLRELVNYPEHRYVVVLSSAIARMVDDVVFPEHITLVHYSQKITLGKIVTGRDTVLDKLVDRHRIDKVFSVFGPTYWYPRVKHLCGFAMPFYVYKDSPFWNLLGFRKRVGYFIREIIKKRIFKHSAHYFVTENPDVSDRLSKIFKRAEIFTVTNYYNQVFDHKNLWDRTLVLPPFEGTTFLTIAANYPHKNLSFIPKVAIYLKANYPDFPFRFVLSLDSGQLDVPESIKENVVFIGKVEIAQCPILYELCDFLFLPTLLECFSASYPEAMKMRRPIITSDLPFAHGLCGEAACYVDTLSTKETGDAVYKLACDKKWQQQLVSAGEKQLELFDDYKTRARKYIELTESI